jgi:hypothetical protein
LNSSSDGDDSVIIESPLSKRAQGESSPEIKAKSKHKIVLKNESISGTVDSSASPFANKKQVEANNKDLESVDVLHQMGPDFLPSNTLKQVKKTKKINMED